MDFHDEMVSVTCFYGTRLLSSNTYPARERYEALFNIANVWEHQSLDQNTDLLVLSGNLRENSESADTLRRLIRNVEELKPDTPNGYLSLPTDILLALNSVES